MSVGAAASPALLAIAAGYARNLYPGAHLDYRAHLIASGHIVPGNPDLLYTPRWVAALPYLADDGRRLAWEEPRWSHRTWSEEDWS